MPKTKISEYSATANSNTDVASINIDEGCAPSGINNAIRAVMGHLKDFQQGTNGDPFNGPVNGTLGATTASTANVTTLTTSSTVTHNGGTANGVAYLNGSKVLTTGSALTFDGTNFATTGAGTFSGLLSRIHVQGTDAYITNTTTGKANTVMGFNDSGSTTAQGIPTGYAYYGTLQSYPVGFTSGGYLTNSISSTAHIWNTTGSEQMRLTSTGLGIGTSSPANKFVVSNAGANGFEVNPVSGVSSGAALNGYNRSTSAYTPLTYSALAHYFQVGSSPSTQATLDASGNLGLGETSPTAKLHIGVASAAVNGTKGVRITNPAGTVVMLECGSGGDSFVGTTSGSDFNIRTNNVTRATFDNSGNLLVNTTSAVTTTVGSRLMYGATDPYISSTLTSSSNATTSYLLYSTGAAAYRFYVGMGGTVYATNTTISAISDQRLKENIRDLDDGLASVMALKPRKFDWKEGKGANIKDARGFIAQEFETVFPDMIDEWKDPAPEGEEPYKAINANLIPTLVKAIQEQQSIIQSLTARITALEGA